MRGPRRGRSWASGGRKALGVASRFPLSSAFKSFCGVLAGKMGAEARSWPIKAESGSASARERRGGNAGGIGVESDGREGTVRERLARGRKWHVMGAGIAALRCRRRETRAEAQSAHGNDLCEPGRALIRAALLPAGLLPGLGAEGKPRMPWRTGIHRAVADWYDMVDLVGAER